MRSWKVFLLAVFFLGITLVFILKSFYPLKQSKPFDLKKIEIESPAFKQGEFIPRKFTCEGENINPPLFFKNIPDKAKSLVLIVDDPDAPVVTWYHWLVYNIDPEVKKIREGELPRGGVQLNNSFGYIKYGGPCPPPGKPHRYFFKVHALKEKLPVKIESKDKLFQYLKKYSIAYGELMGLFSR